MHGSTVDTQPEGRTGICWLKSYAGEGCVEHARAKACIVYELRMADRLLW